MIHTPSRLSTKAFSEFKTIFKREFPDANHTDAGLEATALGVLKLFQTLAEPEPKSSTPKIELSEREQTGLEFIGDEAQVRRTPTARGLVKGVGLRSSRSGPRLQRQRYARAFGGKLNSQ